MKQKKEMKLDIETKMKMMRELFEDDVRVFVEVKEGGEMQFIGVERSQERQDKQVAFDITTKDKMKRPDYYG